MRLPTRTFTLLFLALCVTAPGRAQQQDRPADPGLYNRFLEIGPVEGLTTVWHQVPRQTAIPLGASLEFRVRSVRAVQWSGAEVFATGPFESVARHTVHQVGLHTVTVTFRDEKGDLAVEQAVLDVVDTSIAPVRVSAVRVEAAPVRLDPTDLNPSTLRYYFQDESIARLNRLGVDRYSTSINRWLSLEPIVEPAGFEPLIEWRHDGEVLDSLGRVRVRVFIARPTVMLAGPLGGSHEVRLESYRVRITSHSRGDKVPEWTPVTFTAETEPPGYESEITWLASTKYGTGLPATGRGPHFTVNFRTTFGDEGQWLGVKADQAKFGMDEKTPPSIYLTGALPQSPDGAFSLYETHAPLSLGEDPTYRVRLFVRFENNESTTVTLQSVKATLDHGDTMEAARDQSIEPGDEGVVELPHFFGLETPPTEMEAELVFANFPMSISMSIPLAPRTVKYRLPAQGRDLGPNRYWRTNAGWHDPVGGRQAYAYDFHAVEYDPDFGWTRGEGTENADRVIWDARVYAMASGVVQGCINDEDENPRPGEEVPDCPENNPVEPCVSSDGGNQVVVLQDNGETAFYYHLQRGSLSPEIFPHCRTGGGGVRVEAGDFLGRVGNSGDSSGPHLHVQVSRDGLSAPLLFHTGRTLHTDLLEPGEADSLPWVDLDGQGLARFVAVQPDIQEWATNEEIVGQSSRASPSMAEYQGLLHMVHRGESTREIWHSTFDGTTWTEDVEIGQQTQFAPALATFAGLLHLVYKGSRSREIWHSTYDGVRWTEAVQIGQRTKAAPALAVYQDRLHLVHLGAFSDEIWHSWFDGTSWRPNTRIGQTSSDPPALAAYGDRLHLVHTGEFRDTIWHSTFDGTAWTPNSPIPGQTTKTSPALVEYGGLLHMLHLGDFTDRIWHSSFDGARWLDNYTIGQTSSEAPAMTEYLGRLHMVHVGESRPRIWHSWLDK